MENTLVGKTININRSDGRVHEALVMSVNNEGKMLRVEWYENNETKGKDVDFKAAKMLNPNLNLGDTVAPYIADTRTNRDNLVGNKTSQTNGNAAMTTRSEACAIPVNGRRTNLYQKRVLSGNVITRASEAQASSSNGVNHESNKRCEIKKPKQSNKSRLTIVNKPKNKSVATMIAEYREKLTFNSLAMSDEPVEDHTIAVCVRKRPLNKMELNRQEVDILSVTRKNCLIVHEPRTKVDLTKYVENHTFNFDYAFDEKCDNSTVYKYTAQPLVYQIFNGGYATCFAYGQTGSGKTYTMSGDMMGNEHGIYALAIADVFKLISSPKYRSLKLTVSCSFFEIYGLKVLDLLNKKAILKILEDGKQIVQVVGLMERPVSNYEDVLALIHEGNMLRTSGQTSANSNSSRSHAIFQIFLKNKSKIHGKLSLIDLAGNERGADTYASDRQTRLEGGEINKALLALKECIRALGQKGAHLPFRMNKLTHVLRDSFVGNNSRTCMIAMVSPGINSSENTLNTLRYADRVKEIGSGKENHNELNPPVPPKISVSSPSNEVVMIDDDDDSDNEAELLDSENTIYNNLKVVTDLISEAEDVLIRMQNDNRLTYKKSCLKQYENLIDQAVSNLMSSQGNVNNYKSKLARL